MSNSKTILIILDGWGHGDKSKSDAIFHAKTPYIDSLYINYPNSELLTDGNKVGLPNGQMGNSEVGHLNIGAGRIVDQDLVCLLYTSPSPRDMRRSRMPSSA